MSSRSQGHEAGISLIVLFEHEQYAVAGKSQENWTTIETIVILQREQKQQNNQNMDQSKTRIYIINSIDKLEMNK